MKAIKSIIKNSYKLKLLYVEDNEEARNAVLSILEEFFEDITVCVNGKEGLEAFKSKKIDLVITDINMPKMNGLEMTSFIREINEDVSILVFSAHNEPKYFVDSIKLGIDGYLLKPIEMKQLLGAFSKVINKINALKDRELLKQYKEITDRSSIISIINDDGIITYVNDAFCKVTEYSKEELIGKEYQSIMSYKQPKEIYTEIWKTLRERKEIWQGITKNITKNKKPYYLNSTIKPILDTAGNIIEYIALRNDITAIMSPQKQLNDLIESAKIPMVIMIKIDDFDDIEDFYGQNHIETIVNKFADRLFEFMPKDFNFEKIFSIGNGEFVFAKDKQECRLSGTVVVDILKKFQQEINEAHIDIGEIDYDISIVISFAYGNDALENAKYGLKHLYEKQSDFILANDFAQQKHDEAESNFRVLKMIKKAVIDKKITSYFQAIVDNRTKEVHKYESLVRLIDENDNVIAPFFFIDISKRGKHYAQITSMVLDNSFYALEQTDKKISINLSILDIEKSSTRKKVVSLLNEHKQSANRVVFELLEDENVKDFELVKSFIGEVKELGAQIAIDDFGSGYSNFERLLDYQPDILKIDGSLIKNIVEDRFSESVVKSIVAFAKAENIKVIAEYVENEEIYKKVCQLGIDYSQGYYFAKPSVLESL